MVLKYSFPHFLKIEAFDMKIIVLTVFEILKNCTLYLIHPDLIPPGPSTLDLSQSISQHKSRVYSEFNKVYSEFNRVYSEFNLVYFQVQPSVLRVQLSAR
jgi:hypothetical protein